MAVIAHLTDVHLGATWTTGDEARRLDAVLAHIAAAAWTPDLVLVTGDVVEAGGAAAFARVLAALRTLGAPVLVVPGNLDDPDALGPGRPQHRVADVDGVSVVGLDSHVPGEVGGRLAPDELEWAAAALDARRDRPCLLALHHPPLRTDAAGQVGLDSASTAALDALLDANPHVLGVLCGHLHRTVVGARRGRVVIALSSVAVQMALHSTAEVPPRVPGPPQVAVHTVAGGELVSHVEVVGG